MIYLPKEMRAMAVINDYAPAGWYDSCIEGAYDNERVRMDYYGNDVTPPNGYVRWFDGWRLSPDESIFTDSDTWDEVREMNQLPFHGCYHVEGNEQTAREPWPDESDYLPEDSLSEMTEQ
jgi:hypothetical protein